MKQYYLFARLGLLLCLLTFSLATTAQSMFDPTHVYRITNVATGRTLEVGGGDRYTEGHIVNTWAYWGGAHQQWQFEYLQGGFQQQSFYVTNRNSRQRLSIGRRSWLSIFRTAAQYSNSSASVNTVMIINKLVNGHYLIRTRNPDDYNEPQGMGFYPSGSDNVYFSTAFENEEWEIVDVSTNPGVFRIINYNSGKALSATANDNRVTQWPMWYLAGQEWTFTDYNADGYLYIVNRNTGQVLEIGGSGDVSLPGRTANLWDQTGGENQQWALLDINDSHRLTVQEIFTTGIRCKIYNRHSGKVLEIGGNGSELFQDDRPANQWYDWSGPNQQWNIYIDSANRGTASGTASAQDGTGETKDKTAIASTAATSSPLTLYPNPARTTLHVSVVGQSELSRVTVTDAKGSALSVPCRQGVVDVSGLAPGLYMVTVPNGQHTYRQKFVKE